MNTRLQEMNMLKDVTIAVSSNRLKRQTKKTQRVGDLSLMRWGGVGKGRTSDGARYATRTQGSTEDVVGVNGGARSGKRGEGMGRCQAKE